MKLYHGTTEPAWQSIQAADAILPRALSKRNNWGHTIASHPQCVYLTDTYAPYFGITAIDETMLGDDDNIPRCAIIEIETDRITGNLVPDEDALEQSTRPKGAKGRSAMYQRTRKHRATLHTHRGTDAWRQSLAFMGTCAHYGIVPVSAVTRVALIPIRDDEHSEHASWALTALQPLITYTNYKFCGEDYRAHLARGFTLPRTEIIEINL